MFHRKIWTTRQNSGGLWPNCGLLERCLNYSAIILMVLKCLRLWMVFKSVMPHTCTHRHTHSVSSFVWIWSLLMTVNCEALRCAALKSDNFNDSLPGILSLGLLAWFWTRATVLYYFCLTTRSSTFLKHAVRASQLFFLPAAVVSVQPLGSLPCICTNLSPMKQLSSRPQPPTKVHRVFWLNTCCLFTTAGVLTLLFSQVPRSGSQLIHDTQRLFRGAWNL